MLPLIIFVLTLFGILRRPFGLGIWVYSSVGGLFTLGLGLVEWHHLGFILSLIWDSALTLIALIVISLCLQGLGFFEWLIFWVMKICATKGAESTAILHINTKIMFISLTLFAVILSAVLANDGAILVLTPLVLGLFLRAKNASQRQIIIFLFAVGFVCDISSNPLIISNLTNIITAHFHSIAFGDFALRMLLPNLFASFGALALFLAVFRNDFSTTLTLRAISTPKLSNALFALHLALFGVFIISCFFFSYLSFNCGIYAGILLVMLWRKSPTKAINALKSAPFGIIIFVFGLFVVVFGVVDFAKGAFFALFSEFAGHKNLGIFGVGILSAIGSSVINNLPMVLFGNLVIDEFFASHFAIAQHFEAQNLKESFIYAHLLGCNIGSKLTPIGSLCTLLWLSLIAKSSIFAQKGIKFGFLRYFKYALIFTLPTLFCAIFGLWLTI